MRLYNRAIRKYNEEGFRSLLGTSVEFIGKQIQEGTLLEQKQEVIESYSDDHFYLNIGGGQFVRDNWRVLDFYSQWYDYDERFIDYNVDLEEGSQWPIEEQSVDLIFTGHTLEHLSDAAIKHTLQEAARILRSGGGIRISVPDIDIAIQHYENQNLEWYTEFRPNSPPRDLYSYRNDQKDFVLEEYLLSVFATHLTNARISGTTDQHCADLSQVRSDYNSMGKQAFFQKYSNRVRDEWQSENPGLHRNWFDYQRLVDLLSDAGFKNIRKKCSQQSVYTEFCRPEFGKRPYLSLNVEAEI
jgi:predicted SAM-dependent methyltransferase